MTHRSGTGRPGLSRMFRGFMNYRVVSLMGTLIPRIPGINKGDVAFFFGRVEF
jgi:hypothetical protein